MKILCVGIITPRDAYIEARVSKPVEAAVIVRAGTFEGAWRRLKNG